MSDDCQNNWGCVLSICSTKKIGVSSYADERILRDKISVTFGKKFVLAKVMSSGSDANMHAVMSATNGDTNAMLIAAGSYVSGDNGTMQSFSSSEFSLKIGISGIARPSKVTNQFTRKHTIALAYSIEGALSPIAQIKYEDECIKMLHLRCLVAKVKNCPVRVILLELMLASNGASLSDRFLTMLGKIGTCFDIRFIVDEIMTSGRTGTMLMLLQKPKEFQDRVSHVTLGKWTQKGLVLVSSKFYDETLKNSSHTEHRMLSRHVDCRDVLVHWNAVKKNLHLHEKRREKVLKKLNMQQSDTWGKGTLMFVPLKRNGLNSGLLNRLLPLLDLKLPVDTIVAEKKKKGLSKTEVNSQTVECVKEWLQDVIYEDDLDKWIYELVKYLVKSSDTCHEFEKIHEKVFRKETNRTATAYMHRLREVGLLKYKLVGLQRVRRWIVSDLCRQKNFLAGCGLVNPITKN